MGFGWDEAPSWSRLSRAAIEPVKVVKEEDDDDD
jgi:hypothetical protein